MVFHQISASSYIVRSLYRVVPLQLPKVFIILYVSLNWGVSHSETGFPAQIPAAVYMDDQGGRIIVEEELIRFDVVICTPWKESTQRVRNQYQYNLDRDRIVLRPARAADVLLANEWYFERDKDEIVQIDLKSNRNTWTRPIGRAPQYEESLDLDAICEEWRKPTLY